MKKAPPLWAIECFGESLNSTLIRASDMTRSRFYGNIIGYSEKDKVEGKGTYL